VSGGRHIRRPSGWNTCTLVGISRIGIPRTVKITGWPDKPIPIIGTLSDARPSQRRVHTGYAMPTSGPGRLPAKYNIIDQTGT
jgi:hypothetical protein